METPCACGCGQIVTHKVLEPSRLFYQGPKRFIAGHQNRGLTHSPDHIAKTTRPMELNGRWRGGRFIDQDGYALIKRPDHPHARISGYVLEHRIVMEQHLGRVLLPNEVVHHKNSQRSDNRLENLHLCVDSAEHVRVERTGRKYPRKDGIWFTCEHCHQPFYRCKSYLGKPVRWCSWACRYSR